MRIIEAVDYEDLSRKAAGIIASQITLKPASVLGLATGSSPVGLYRCLVEWYKNGDLDFSRVSSVNLDEYKGLSGDNDQSYRYFMNSHLFDHVNIDKARTFVPNGLEPDSSRECARYDQVLADAGQVDIQLLGMGHNGHIGFNEPEDFFEKGTHCVDLAPSTIEANKRFFQKEEDVPRQAYTMGIGSIMQAAQVLVVVSGAEKAEILAEAFAGPVTPRVPASVLQLHQNVVLVADQAALGKLKERMEAGK
ncbi:MAG: glucosamine-6-phosphate deaminase [Lachnospiraceae bacterium]|jgi:glucosamine-6-phosphate deaminase|nr:glucosamine-6-phosphate deaminase [Lachnospiraceae bacterium]